MLEYFNKLLRGKDELFSEEYEAFFFKLPPIIEVTWNRDGKWIIGRIHVGEKEATLMTQAKNPEEFLDMVNDAIYMHFGVKEKYKKFLKHSSRFYKPPFEAWVQLNEGRAASSTVRMKKDFAAA